MEDYRRNFSTGLPNDIFHPLQNSGDLDPLMEKVGDSRYVLLGEATHGTHEFYTWRTQITKRLIEEKGFNVIAVEGDWPDCYKINRWIKGYADAGDKITDVLKQFSRWPTWMWANWEIAALAEWLRNFNLNTYPGRKVGFYGLDVYSLWESMETIINYLQKEDPKTVQHAKDAVNCFEPFGTEDSYASALNALDPQCKEQVLKLLVEVRKNAPQYNHDPEAGLNIEMNALVAKNAEKYYRTMAGFGGASWNVRDLHMVETLNSIMKFHGEDAKVIVWEHNTHIGDARYTDMADEGLLNVGQLVREQAEQEGVVLVGFGSYEGTVIAGKNWGAPMEVMEVPKAKETSIEGILHHKSPDNKLLIFNGNADAYEPFHDWLGHRAIGVVFNPRNEKYNYVPTKLASRYDAFLFLDKTKALNPIPLKAEGLFTPETYPFGI